MPRPRKTAPADAQSSAAGERPSPVTENYLLSLYKMWEDGEVPTLTQLTEALRQLPPTEGLGTSVPSVAGMLRRMQKQGLVEIGSDKRIRLTNRGKTEGENIARRHRLEARLARTGLHGGQVRFAKPSLLGSGAR